MTNAQIIIMFFTVLIVFLLIGVALVAELHDIRKAITDLKESEDNNE